MGLINSLNIATSGLRATQAGISIVANNVAQAEVEGYKRQDLQTSQTVSAAGVRSTVARASDSYLENQYRLETAKSAAADVRDYYLSRVDRLFGSPGGAGSLDSVFGKFSAALEKLSTSPDDYTVQKSVITAAQNLAGALNGISEEIQALRQTAEDNIASIVGDVGDALQRLETLNVGIANARSGDVGFNELLNERDRQLARLSDAMDVRVVERDNGTVAVFTASGDTLVDRQAVDIRFDAHGNIGPQSLYSADADERGVGTVSLYSSSTYSLDLINNGVLGNGRLGALIEMRDDVLVGAQAQLDELAGNLARTLSNVTVKGTTASSGAANGFDIDLDGLQKGDTISLAYTEGSIARNVTIVRVDDPSQLPLSASAVPGASGRVIGVDFSAGYAAAAAAINAELGPAVTVSALADGLRFLDDGATATSDITSLASAQTASDLQDGSDGMPLFMDGNIAQVLYSGSLDGPGQKTGFAARIGVNQAVIADSETLVKKSAGADIGDTSRPRALIERLGSSTKTFSPETGIGSTRAPFSGSVMQFARLVVADQTGKAENARQAKTSQDVVTASVESKLSAKTGVDIDTELTKLIALQNSFAANARIVQTAQELFDRLMQI